MIPDWPLDTVIVTTVTFAELDGKTHLTIRQVLEPAEANAKDSVRRERQGARAGWMETLNRLDAYVGARA
jgi:uncharacterized protein YndB with AHSA1/START domain